MLRRTNGCQPRTANWTGGLAIVLATGMAACGGAAPEPAAEPMEETAPAAPAEDRSSTAPTVGFVTPTDGATVTSPVSMEFIVSNLNISPVLEGLRDPAAARCAHADAADW
jgi:hypothetical protein